MTIKLDLTNAGLFSGLYETIWLNEFSFEMYEEGSVDIPSISAEDINVDYPEYLKLIGQEYAGAFGTLLSEQGVKVAVAVSDVWSPRWYNNDTDHIILNFKSLDAFDAKGEDIQNALYRVLLGLSEEYPDGLERALFEDYGFELLDQAITVD